jgi:hypothetical protein
MLRVGTSDDARDGKLHVNTRQQRLSLPAVITLTVQCFLRALNSIIHYCSVGGRWQRLADFCRIVAKPSVLHQEWVRGVLVGLWESGPHSERPDPCCAFQSTVPVSQPQ